ncbi:hypothetical protein [Lysinibacillus sp. fls2-241-R2A-57]|uniref:hypothetical protein n=1 Tax=Lysinibacillus sp. fls2-241-R2A-57 TaxID=3040292 RepID=UPI0025534EED|nr:hypothetical protein [Lysinibacillus sp. fls2-241-R2A-57]
MFKKIKQKLLKLLKVPSPSRVMIKVKSTDLGYIKQLEKRGLYTQINNTFSSLIIQKRYDDIVTALKYTKHSKKREQLLKAKRMYEDCGGMNNG